MNQEVDPEPPSLRFIISALSHLTPIPPWLLRLAIPPYITNDWGICLKSSFYGVTPNQLQSTSPLQTQWKQPGDLNQRPTRKLDLLRQSFCRETSPGLRGPLTDQEVLVFSIPPVTLQCKKLNMAYRRLALGLGVRIMSKIGVQS